MASLDSHRPLLEEGVGRIHPLQRRVVDPQEGCCQVENASGAKSLSLPENKRFDRLVSSRKPFGLDDNVQGQADQSATVIILVYQNGGRASNEALSDIRTERST